MRKALWLLVLAGVFVLLAPHVSIASVTYTYSYSSPSDEYIALQGTSPISLSFSLTTLNSGTLEWKLDDGTASSYTDKYGQSFTYGTWYKLPEGSNGEDFINLSSSVGFDLRLTWNGATYDLKQGTNSTTLLSPVVPSGTALVYWLKGGLGSNITTSSANAVPIPGAVWLLASGLAGLAALRRKVAA